jgi:hypothetical protein
MLPPEGNKKCEENSGSLSLLKQGLSTAILLQRDKLHNPYTSQINIRLEF